MKFVITCTMPSGAKYAWSKFKGQFALSPIKGDSVHKVLAWESEDEAEGYLLAQMEVAPQLSKLGPFKIESAHETKP